MNINDIAKTQQLNKKASAKKSTVSNTAGFFELLEGQLHPTEEAAATSETAATASTAETSDIPAQLRLEGISLSENTINMLESYSKALADLNLTEEDIKPLVEALEGDTTNLLNIKEQLPPDDPLALLIDRVATISYIEAEKFRRGDYS